MLFILELILKYILSVCFIIVVVFEIFGILILIYHIIQDKNNKTIKNTNF